MTLTVADMECYEANGFLNLGQMFSPEEVVLLQREARIMGSSARPLSEGNLINEETGEVWRSYSMERDSKAFDTLTRLPRFLERARALLGEHIYLMQTHMNHKAGGRREPWPWHQDYQSWHMDGMPRGGLHDCVIFMIMLDDCGPDIVYNRADNRPQNDKSASRRKHMSSYQFVFETPEIEGLPDDGALERLARSGA